MKKTITSLLFLVTISSSFSYAHSKYFYEKDIQLTGIKKTLSFVDQITEDRTTQIPILKLNKPISVVPTRLDPEEIDVPERNISHI